MILKGLITAVKFTDRACAGCCFLGFLVHSPPFAYYPLSRRILVLPLRTSKSLFLDERPVAKMSLKICLLDLCGLGEYAPLFPAFGWVRAVHGRPPWDSRGQENEVRVLGPLVLSSSVGCYPLINARCSALQLPCLTSGNCSLLMPLYV